MRCPNCGARARGEIPFCPRCGQMLPEPQGGYSPIPEAHTVVCSNCGCNNLVGTRHCSFCGQSLWGTTLWKRKGTWLAVIELISLCSMFISTRLISDFRVGNPRLFSTIFGGVLWLPNLLVRFCTWY